MKAALRKLLGLDSHRRVFNRYYRENVWIGGGSGTGSTVENTRGYREFLQAFMPAKNIRSVLDLGCGDWQFSQHVSWDGIDYLGVDVAPVVIKNAHRFASNSVKFAELDGSTDELPAADLLIAKDVFQHWRTDEILRFLPRLARFKYALITNGCDEQGINSDIRAGQCRPLDMSRPPFSLRGKTVLRYQADEPKAVFLWQRDVIGG
jgi:SAM-dependent methyltransferase